MVAGTGHKATGRPGHRTKASVQSNLGCSTLVLKGYRVKILTGFVYLRT